MDNSLPLLESPNNEIHPELSAAKLLEVIMDNIPQSIFWKDRESNYIYCNRNFAQDAGVETPSDIFGKSDYDLVWKPEEADFFREVDQRVMNRDQPELNFIEPQFQADNKQAWLLTNKVPLHDETGQVVGVLGTYDDITNRIEAEAALEASQRMLRLVIDNIPQAVFWKDINSVYLGCNQAFAFDAGVQSPSEIIGKSDYDLAWTAMQASAFVEDDKRVMVGNQPEYHILERQKQADGKLAWLDTNKIPLRDPDGNVVGLLGTYEDISERILAQRALQEARDRLEIRVKERTVELSEANVELKQQIIVRQQAEDALHRREVILEALTFTSHRLLTPRGLDNALPEVLAQLGQALGYSRAYILQNKANDSSEPSATCHSIWAKDDHPPQFPNFSYVDSGLQKWAQDFEKNQPIYGRFYTISAQAFLDAQEIKSLAWLPIMSEGVWWGVLGFDDCRKERECIPAEIEALKSAANALGAAFAQQRSRNAEREQRTLAEALRDTAALLNSTLNLDEVLDRILSEISKVVAHDAATLILVEAEGYRVTRYRADAKTGSDVESIAGYPVTNFPNLRQMTEEKRPLIIPDTQQAKTWISRTGSEWVRSYLGSPIQSEGEVIGFINLNSATPGFFTELHAERLQAFTDQAATAIQNARLYQQAQILAALEERQRLARDLHDAVSQTLWTANLIADVLPVLYAENPIDGQQSLQKLRSLTGGALAEMRMLLLELRPTALADSNLHDLLTQLAEATMSRKKIEITLTTEGACQLDPDTQVGIYRIAQETLNNVAKHARATQVTMHLRCDQDGLQLRIHDNGRGFDPENIPTERLGVGIMRERAENIGASLEIDSQSGEGTLVQVRWQKRKHD